MRPRVPSDGGKGPDDPRWCSNQAGHVFKDVGLNLAECKYCGLVVMHDGQHQIDTLNLASALMHEVKRTNDNPPRQG